ncbi:MAG: CbiX/SirB N-terminal domain-containing protein, partial [Actinomycetota bacterium]|nr:CbiX/SirB N-terminal domain-containing protein [Actinomycetota bacterium]
MTAGAPPALLVVAHGTRDAAGGREMATLLDLLRARHAGPVAHAWLESFAQPAIPAAVDRLAEAGVTRIASVPLLVFGAGHAKTDVPNGLAAAAAAHPDVAFVHGRVLGLHPGLFALARARIDAVSP